jgi:hypothetical protein
MMAKWRSKGRERRDVRELVDSTALTSASSTAFSVLLLSRIGMRIVGGGELFSRDEVMTVISSTTMILLVSRVSGVKTSSSESHMMAGFEVDRSNRMPGMMLKQN